MLGGITSNVWENNGVRSIFSLHFSFCPTFTCYNMENDCYLSRRDNTDYC